jgi:hypothetical protein
MPKRCDDTASTLMNQLRQQSAGKAPGPPRRRMSVKPQNESMEQRIARLGRLLVVAVEKQIGNKIGRTITKMEQSITASPLHLRPNLVDSISDEVKATLASLSENPALQVSSVLVTADKVLCLKCRDEPQYVCLAIC